MRDHLRKALLMFGGAGVLFALVPGEHGRSLRDGSSDWRIGIPAPWLTIHVWPDDYRVLVHPFRSSAVLGMMGAIGLSIAWSLRRQPDDAPTAKSSAANQGYTTRLRDVGPFSTQPHPVFQMRSELFWIPVPFPGRLAIAPRPRGGDWLGDEI